MAALPPCSLLREFVCRLCVHCVRTWNLWWRGRWTCRKKGLRREAKERGGDWPVLFWDQKNVGFTIKQKKKERRRVRSLSNQRDAFTTFWGGKKIKKIHHRQRYMFSALVFKETGFFDRESCVSMTIRYTKGPLSIAIMMQLVFIVSHFLFCVFLNP